MNDSDELQARIRMAKERSWEIGYFDGRDGNVFNADQAYWPSQYRIGYEAAVSDKTDKAAETLRKSN